ncbi:MAG: 4-hydroxyproline epimerase [Saprospiraceae bacterium]
MPRSIFHCIDAHTCGNPVRVVKEGGPVLIGETMAEKRLDFLAHHDWIRKGLMFEPRGHDMMSGSILYPPHDPANDAAILFIETSGCLPMCGHGTIGTITVAIEQGLITPKEPGIVRLEAPAGLILVSYNQLPSGKVRSVRLTNVPSFLAAAGLEIDAPGLGPIRVDIAYGGNFYAIIDPQEQYTDLADYALSDLIAWSPELRRRLNDRYTMVHPEREDIRGISHILWTGKPTAQGATARNAVFYGEKAIDRSPCGTGTSARMAQWAAMGKLHPDEPFIHESVIGSLFTGRIEQLTQAGEVPAIIPSIEGWAVVTGFNTIHIDPEEDPFAYGFTVG